MIEKLKKKYAAMNPALRMAFWFLVCSFLQRGISFITTPIFTRIMDEAEYGRYGVYTSWSSIVAVFFSLSISGNCFVRGIVIHKEKQDEFTSSLLGLVTICIIIGFFVLIPVTAIYGEKINISPLLVATMLFELLLTNAFNFYYNRKRVEYDYRPILTLTMLFSICRPLAAVIAIKLSDSTQQVEARVISCLFVTLLLYLPIYIRIFTKGRKFYDKDNWKYALTFCLPLIPHYLSRVVLSTSDRIMISMYYSDVEAAYYSVAYALAGVMSFFNSSVSQVFDPWLYKKLNEKQLTEIGPVSYKLVAGIAIINFALVAVAPEILWIAAPENYSQALWAIPPVTASVFFTFMYDLFASFQFFYKKTKWISVASCAGALLNVVLNAIFIPIYGFIAAGYTTLFCYVAFGVFHYCFTKKVCKEHLDGYKVYDGKIIFGIGLALICLCALMMAIYDYWYIRYAILLVCSMIAFVKRKTIIGFVRNLRSSK